LLDLDAVVAAAGDVAASVAVVVVIVIVVVVVAAAVRVRVFVVFVKANGPLVAAVVVVLLHLLLRHRPLLRVPESMSILSLRVW